MVYPHFCININQQFQAGPEVFGSVFPTALLQNDLDYLWNLGIRKVRTPLKTWGSRQIDIDWDRQAAIQTKQKGFSVSLGSGVGNPHKPENWDSFYNFVLTNEVPWLIANGFGIGDVYFLGNENEGSPSLVGMLSATRSSNVVTVSYGDQQVCH